MIHSPKLRVFLQGMAPYSYRHRQKRSTPILNAFQQAAAGLRDEKTILSLEDEPDVD